MIIQQITLHNFGIYGGAHTFDLAPNSNDHFLKPLVVVRGQNGVGKSTLMEAIRLGLHGKLSLGNRPSQKEYEFYLEQRRHRTAVGELSPFTQIELVFDHVFLGQSHQYRVKREWHKFGSNRLNILLNLWVDGEANEGSDEEKEHLLRELVSPGVAELFFFDGEKISTLAEADDGSETLLAQTVKNLLGLHLVEQLDRDLDVYLTRQTGVQELQQYQTEIKELSAELEKKEKEQEELQRMLWDCRQKTHAQRDKISLLEEQLAHEGGQYAATQTLYQQKYAQLRQDLTRNEEEIAELSRGLMPFAVAPNLLRAVRDRLNKEAEYEQWQASQPLLQKIQTRLLKEPEPTALYQVNTTGAKGAATADEQDFMTFVRRLMQEHEQPPLPDTAVIHRVSPETRTTLHHWIDEALTSAPEQLAAALQTRTNLQKELAQTTENLDRVPLLETVQPIQDALRQEERTLGKLEAELERLTAQEKTNAFYLERIQNNRKRVNEQIIHINTDEHRIKLAARTKQLLDNYQQKLMAQKLHQLAQQLTKRFNQLSRKRNLIDHVTIDPKPSPLPSTEQGNSFPATNFPQVKNRC
jgi:DNA sulfur modification protein DndD